VIYEVVSRLWLTTNSYEFFFPTPAQIRIQSILPLLSIAVARFPLFWLWRKGLKHCELSLIFRVIYSENESGERSTPKAPKQVNPEIAPRCKFQHAYTNRNGRIKGAT
jgi:hypothetical protein